MRVSQRQAVKKSRVPWYWMIWHPYEGFANRRVIKLIQRRVRPSLLGNLIIHLVFHVDTSILLMRAMFRRMTHVGPWKFFSKSRLGDDVTVVYLDLGTHADGAELALAVDELLPALGGQIQAYGFEANRSSFESVSKRLSEHSHVELIHAALCHAVPACGTLRLYHFENSLSNSLYRQSNVREEVPAIRLSDFLRDNEPLLEHSIVILRMNIEGAEFDVIQDLQENLDAGQIDGWFGMWDDMARIHINDAVSIRSFLRRHGILNCTFNGRDFAWNFRLRLIRYEIQTAVWKGLCRIRSSEIRNSKPGAVQPGCFDRNSISPKLSELV